MRVIEEYQDPQDPKWERNAYCRAFTNASESLRTAHELCAEQLEEFLAHHPHLRADGESFFKVAHFAERCQTETIPYFVVTYTIWGVVYERSPQTGSSGRLNRESATRSQENTNG